MADSSDHSCISTASSDVVDDDDDNLDDIDDIVCTFRILSADLLSWFFICDRLRIWGRGIKEDNVFVSTTSSAENDVTSTTPSSRSVLDND